MRAACHTILYLLDFITLLICSTVIWITLVMFGGTSRISVKFLSMQLYLPSCHFFSFGFKYSPYHILLEQHLYAFFLQKITLHMRL
jgi:hypothetical protein